MTSRERVRAVLNHQKPDRIPNGLGGCETEGLHIYAYDTLQSVLGVERKNPKMDTFMTNAVFEENVIKAMGGDIILVSSPRMCGADLRDDGTGEYLSKWKDIELWGKMFSVAQRENIEKQPDGSYKWNGNVCPPGHFYFDGTGSTDLLAEFPTPDPDKINFGDGFSDEFLKRLEKICKKLYNETDLSLCLGETITDLQYLPGGMVGGMVLMLEEPDILKAILQKAANAGLKQIKLLDQAVGKYVDILSIAHDLGDNKCVTIGDGLFREIYKPYYMQLFQGWQKLTNMKVNLHSCGSIDTIIGDLIECGLQVLNPVQTSAHGMDVQSLKDRFGDKLVFWGGAYDPQLIPETATYEEVYAAVKRNCEILGKNGGFIFSGVHNLPATLPAHHIRAMLDALKDAKV